MRGKGPKKGEGGRPQIEIDWNLAEKLAYIQCTATEIASTLGVNDETLTNACKRVNRMTFSQWYKKHSENGKSSLRRSMWKMATGERPNPTMAIWLSKNYLGMTDAYEQTPENQKTPSINFIIGNEEKKSPK